MEKKKSHPGGVQGDSLDARLVHPGVQVAHSESVYALVGLGLAARCHNNKNEQTPEKKRGE